MTTLFRSISAASEAESVAGLRRVVLSAMSAERLIHNSVCTFCRCRTGRVDCARPSSFGSVLVTVAGALGRANSQLWPVLSPADAQGFQTGQNFRKPQCKYNDRPLFHIGVPVATEQKVGFALVAVRDNRWLVDISMG